MKTLVLLTLALLGQDAPSQDPKQAIDTLVPVRPAKPATTQNSAAQNSTPPSPTAPNQTSTSPTDAEPANATSGSAPEATPAPIVPAYPGTFDEGFAEIRAHADKKEFEQALATADALLAPNAFLRWRDARRAQGGWRAWIANKFDPLLDTAGWNGLPSAARAELWFAKGVVHELAEKPAGADVAKSRAAAEEAYAQALALAGSLDVGRDALYDLGTLALRIGEEERAKLPEVSGKSAAAAPPMMSAPGGADAKAPDPLELARAAYMKARAHYVDRLKVGALDPDTQANTELVMKRLRELDEIQKKREEQKKKDEQKKNDEQKNDKKDNKDQDKQDKDKQKQDQKDKQDKQDSKDKSDKQEPPKDPQADEKDKKDEKKPEDAKPDEKKPDEKDAKKQPQPDPNEQKPQEMSKEQMTQILDRLQQLEDQSKKIQEQLRAARRAKVKKDW